MRYELADHESAAIKPILPNKTAACHAATTGGPQWHLGLAIRSVRPAYRAHVMVPFAELEGRLEY
jgi:hypothetical protein